MENFRECDVFAENPYLSRHGLLSENEIRDNATQIRLNLNHASFDDCTNAQTTNRRPLSLRLNFLTKLTAANSNCFIKATGPIFNDFTSVINSLAV